MIRRTIRHFLSTQVFMKLRVISILFLVAAAGGPAHPGAAIRPPDSRDPGAYIEGVETLEGDPAGGLSYRLRMSPDASPQAPDRLLVWFHPSGRSMNRIVEAMSPVFVRHGFALLVATGKDFGGWSDLDIGRMMNVTLREVGRIEGIDAERPVLMGFSAGGQAALALWHAAPNRYAGLIVDAAYPLRLRSGSHEAQGPPGDSPGEAGGGSSPVFVLVGTDDELASSWREAEPSWRKAGVALTIRYVPGRGHEWLLDGENLGALESWLDSLGGPTAGPGADSSD